MERIPKGWMFTLGLSVLAVVSAMVVSNVSFPDHASTVAGDESTIEADSCFRYGRLECCVKPE